MTCLSGQNATLKQLTPWLKVGTYTLRVENHNFRADCNLRIQSLTIQRLGGNSSNPTDPTAIPLWAAAKMARENLLTSRTSPACIEGMSSWGVDILSTTRPEGVPPSDPPPYPIDVLTGPDSLFYANVPLDPTGTATPFTLTYQNGILSDPRAISWTPTNIFEEANTTLTLRTGDSLLLTAHQGATPTGTFSLQGDAGVPSAAIADRPANQPLPLEFTTPGTHTLTAVWTPEGGAPTEPKALTVIVKAADFGPDFIVQAHNRRTWTLPGVNAMDIEAGSDLTWVETTAPGASSRSFTVDAYQTGPSYVLARLPETGDIVARGTVSAFTVARVGETADAQLVEIRPDGSRIFRFTIVAEGMPDNVNLELNTYFPGATFPSGSRDLVLEAADLDENGIASILIEWPGDLYSRVCHTLRVVLAE
jgi:hypothetical protein